MNHSIEIKGLSKAYKRVNHAVMASYRTLREDLTKLFTGSFLKKKDEDQFFWALKDIDLEVQPGEVVGIIGPNGSGKSTLLKLLSRITPPTKGQIDIYGRVGALLEVGTGFHIDLTGRENIYLSGSILGMRRHEISKSFDEIVEFAEIGPFVDVPVKKYSSGMFLRLAFSVMAHLRTEIVIVDEVLAVGDASFQKKCLGKMENVAHQGRTVFYVSHHLETISSLCTRCLFLKKGHLIKDGQPREVIDEYYKSLRQKKFFGDLQRTGRGNFKFTDFWIEDSKGDKIDVLQSGNDYKFVYTYEITSQEDLKNIDFEIQIATAGNFQVTKFTQQHARLPTVLKAGSQGQVVCSVNKLPLNSGQFQCHLMAKRGGQYGEIEDFVSGVECFSVEPGPFLGHGIFAPKEIFLLLEHTWEHQSLRKELI
ncbi:MAG TPA: ABC transporter ATP-binding protein [Chlamydiales bacterium]|nr:ABC transporter ATP-binding protein [Chlamydiales bacterium]